MSTRYKAELRRKLFHIVACILLLIPLKAPFLSLGLTPIQFYALAAAVAAGLNAWQVKRGIFLDGARINSIIDKFTGSFTTFPEFTGLVVKLEKILREFMKDIEREYETRSGYIGATFGTVGVLSSYALFGNHVLQGILALMIVDPTAALVGTRWGRRRFLSDRSVEGSLAAMTAYSLVLILAGHDPLYSLILSLVAVVSEAISIEDNLLIPLSVSATSYILTQVFRVV